MTRGQRITGSIVFLLLGGILGRFWLFSHLQTTPNDLTTTVQPVSSSGGSSLLSGTIINPDSTQTTGSSSETTGNSSGTDFTDNETVSTGSLTILLPPRFSSEDRAQLNGRIQQQTTIVAKAFQPKTLYAYLKAITILTTGSRQADIMLIPRNEHTQLSGRGLHAPWQTSPAPFLHPQLNSLLEDQTLTFFPYAIDPRVTVLQQPVSTPSLTLAKLLQQITLAHDLFPLGISNQILLKLAAAQEPRPRFFRLFALWLNQTAIVDSPETLTVLLKSQDTGLVACFDRVGCLGEYTGLYALWLPLSQAEQEQVDPSQIGITSFPSITDGYPADVRGWVINKHSPQLTTSAQRIESYLKLLIQDELPYHDRLLPVLQSRFQRLLLQPQRQRLRSTAYRFQWLTVSTDTIAQLIASMPVKELIEGTYSPSIFLQQRLKQTTP